MKFAAIRQNIQYIRQCLASAIQIDNIEVQANERMVSWSPRIPGIRARKYYPLEYQWLLDKHQYSLLLSDGSFFQIYYRFDENDKLLSGRLAYFPPPVPTEEDAEGLLDGAALAADLDNVEVFEHLYNIVELLDSHKIHPANTGHFRFDYDPSAVATHSASHLQFSGVNDIRIEADFFPMPAAFIQLALSAKPVLNGLSEVCLNHSKHNVHVLDEGEMHISLRHST